MVPRQHRMTLVYNNKWKCTNIIKPRKHLIVFPFINHIYLSIYLSISSLHIYLLSIFRYVYEVSSYLSIYLSIYLILFKLSHFKNLISHLSQCQSASLYFSQSVSLSLSLHFSNIYIYIYIYIYMCVCVCVCQEGKKEWERERIHLNCLVSEGSTTIEEGLK